MSGGVPCRCDERKRPIAERRWVVVDFMCNHSAFNGYHYTSSAYSAIRCDGCGGVWRTKAAYVDELRSAGK